MKIRRVSVCFRITAGVITFVIFVLLVGLYTPIGGLISIGFEGTFTKWSIDNPYVDDHYSGWNEVSFGADDSIKIPENWTMEDKNGVYSIIDETGSVWAVGAEFGTASDKFSSYADLIAMVTSTKVSEVSIDPYPEFEAMQGADIDRLLITKDLEEDTYYCIELMTETNTLIVLVLYNDLTDSSYQFDIAEAIVYSFAF